MWSRKVTDTIGWVYEGDREKIRKAQDDLDDFYRQDNIDDLEATRDKEKELLDDRIEQIDLYLQALQYKAKEYERILRDQLLMEMMNADSMAEVKDKILLDWDEFNKGCDGSFKNYNGIFTNFMNEYRDNVLELDSIQKQMNDVLSSTLSGLMDTNNQNIQMGINNTSNIANAMGMSEADKQALAAAGRKYTIAQKAYLETNLAQYKQAMEQAHQQAEAIRAKYGYSGGIDGSALIVTDEGLYAQYMGGSGYKEQMETEEDFYNFYSDLFGDFNSAEGDRISDLRNYGNSLTSNYNSINSDGKSYVVGEENNLDDHRSNYYYQSDINDDIISNWLMYMDDANISYDYIIMDFESFIDKYRGMIEEYADLAGSIGNINPGTGGSSGGMEGDDYWMDKMTAADREALQAAGQKYNEALAMYQQTGLQYYKDMMEEAHAEAEAIRNKYGYSGGDDGSEWIPTNYTALSGSTMVGDNKYKGSMSASDQAALSQAGSDYNTYKELYEKTGNTQYKTLMNQAHDRAEEIRSKYGYSGGADGSLLLETTKNNYNQLNTIESERVGAYGSYISSIMGLQNKESSINLSSLSDFQNYISGTSSAYSTKNTLELTANANEAYNVSVHGDNAYEQAGINADIVNDWLMYNNDTQVQYDLVNMQFSDFLSKYAQQIQEYANLQSQLAGIMGGSMEIPGNVISGGANYGSGGSSGGGMKGDSAYSGAMSDYDKTMLSQAGADYNKYKQLYEQTGETKYKDMMNQAHDRAESIRNKYVYSGGVDGSENITIGSSKASTMSTVSALSSSLAMVPSSSSSSSSKKSSSSSKRGSAFEDVSNLPGGSYVQSDGTVYYPSGMMDFN